MMVNPPRDQQIFRQLAFIGRYGHQPMEQVLRLTVHEMNTLAEQISSLLEEEAAQVHDG